MNAPQLAPPRLEDVVRKIQGISTLPHIALKIIKITSDTNSSASDLEDVIKSDPGLTAKLLKMVKIPKPIIVVMVVDIACWT